MRLLLTPAYLLCLLSSLTYIQTVFSQPNVSIADMQCEYLHSPIGIDAAHPRFTWRLVDERQGAKQTAYTGLVDTDSTALVNGNGKIWNSRKISSDATLATYNGLSLQPFTKYYWRVIAYDVGGIEQGASSIAS